MIDRGAEQRATLKSASELPGQLLHAANGCHLRHVFAQHFKVFKQNVSLVFQRGLEDFAAMNCVFNLAKDPWVGHCAAANQDTFTAGFAKPRERLFDRSYVTAA